MTKRSHSEPPLDPRCLTPAQLSKLLSATGGRVITVAMIEQDLGDGAPMNGDGTVNLIYYGAWLSKSAK